MRYQLLSHVTALKHNFRINNIKNVSSNTTENKLCHRHSFEIIRAIIPAYSENYRGILGDSVQIEIFPPTKNPKRPG